jgi:hypothetical protein
MQDRKECPDGFDVVWTAVSGSGVVLGWKRYFDRSGRP